jgi:hypothetical protein
LPFNQVNAVFSRLPVGVVNLLRGQPVLPGPSLHRAYLPLNLAALLTVLVTAVAAWYALRARHAGWSAALLLLAIISGAGLPWTGLNAAILAAFAPDFAVVLVVLGALLCLPAAWRVAARLRRAWMHQRMPATA